MKPRFLRRSSRANVGCALLFVLVGATVSAQNQREFDPPWRDLESELRQQRIQTDTKSLIDVVLSNRDSGTRWMAIEILGLRKEAAARDALRRVLDTADDRLLNESAALALARLGDESGKAALAKLMPTAASLERQIFLAARLAEFGNPAGYQFVVQAATSKDPHLKYIAVGALVPFVPLEGRAGPAPLGPKRHLLQLLEDPDPNVRKEVLNYLPTAISKGLSGAEARPIVEKLAKDDPDPDVRERARFTLIAWPGAQRQ